ncbi:MAG: helix-turn-helix domain-containing protein [Fibromonadales bacterium]|nr:helix-turn-helix domain-containing protein [Fibromonadales bacterium]
MILNKRLNLRKPITQAFQFLLTDQRNSRNMTQSAFSRKCGFSRQYISLVENGKRMPSFDFALNMAYVFKINVKDFMLLILDKIFYYESLKCA